MELEDGEEESDSENEQVTLMISNAASASISDDEGDNIVESDWVDDPWKFGLNLDSKLLVDAFDATKPPEAMSSTGEARLKEAKVPPKDNGKWVPLNF